MHGFFNQVGYLDPTTGSIIIQAVVGVTAGVAVFGRKVAGKVSRRARSLFRKGDNKEEL